MDSEFRFRSLARIGGGQGPGRWRIVDSSKVGPFLKSMWVETQEGKRVAAFRCESEKDGSKVLLAASHFKTGREIMEKKASEQWRTFGSTLLKTSNIFALDFGKITKGG